MTFVQYITILICFSMNLISQIPADRVFDWSNAGSKSNFKYNKIIVLNKEQLNIEQLSNSTILNNLIIENQGKSVQIILPEGSFTFDKPINLKSNISLKGQGAEKTELIFDLDGTGHCININGSAENSKLILSKDILLKEKKIIAKSDNFINNNVWLKIEFEDKALLFSDWAYGSVAQIQKVNNVIGDTIFLNSEFRREFKISDVVKIMNINPIENVSIECLKIKRLDNTTPEQTSNINFSYAVNSRVYNIESENCNFSHIQASYSSNLVISNSYLHDAFEYGGGGRAYGVLLHFSTGEVLAENNIFKHLRHSMILQAGANGNVFAYNYSVEPFWSETSLPENSSGDMVLHGNYVFANLFENNICQNIVIDNSHGANGAFNTIFRNRAELWGIFFSADSSPSQNIIGNEITNNNFPYNLLNYNILGENHFLFANNNKGNFSPNKPDSLPIKSLYYKHKPEFLSESEFGGIGFPNTVKSNSIPAKGRFDTKSIFDLLCSDIPNNVEKESNKVHFYPNPCSEYLIIDGQIDFNKINIFNIFGDKINTYKIINSQIINISQLKSGVYFIEYGQFCYKFIKI